MTLTEYQHNLELLLQQTKITLKKQQEFFLAKKNDTHFNAMEKLKEAKREEELLKKLIADIERKINMNQTELF